MAINASKYKRSISCRYCGTLGHSVQHCTKVNEDGAKAQKKADSGQVLNYMENYALQRWQKNQDIATARSSRTTPRKPRKCGFCGSEGHNRRHCGELKAVKQKLHDANKIWRRFWAKSAVDYGFAPASLVKITMESWYAQRNMGASSFISLVGNEMPENLTIFAMADDYDMRQEVQIPLTGENLQSIKPKDFVPNDSMDRQYLYSGYGWSSVDMVEVLGKSNYVYPQEWIEAYPEDIDYAVKKWSKQKLASFLRKVEDFVEYAEHGYNIHL
tara:strand:+ start:1683 stop:2495 length:813 start_codon:yes stop_codon:yes gene_type:complete